MICARVIFALALIACAGKGAAIFTMPRRGANVAELLGVAVLFGGAIISLALFIVGLVAPDPLLHWIVAALAIAFGAFGFFRARNDFELEWPREIGLLGVIFLAILGVQIAFVAWQSIAQTLRWDGLFCWEIKAHIAALNGGRIPSSTFTDIERLWSHPQYPAGLPMLEEWLYSWIGEPHQGWAKVLFPFVYLAAAMLLSGGIFKLTRDARLAIAGTLLPFFVPCLVIGPGSASSGWADFPLATVYLAAVIYLLDYARGGALGSLRLFACCAAILPWVKQEGVILAGCLFLIGFVVAAKRREARWMLAAAIPTMLIFCGWKLFLVLMKAPPQTDFLPFTRVIFFQNWLRILLVAKFARRRDRELEPLERALDRRCVRAC